MNEKVTAANNEAEAKLKPGCYRRLAIRLRQYPGFRLVCATAITTMAAASST